MVYIGIDPGAKGAYSAFHGIRNEAEVFPFDEEYFVECMRQYRDADDVVCALEHVNAMPGQGVTSMFNFGQNFGFIQGVLKAYNIPFELVRPAKWKKEFSITADKNTSIEVCKRLFPNISLRRTERCKKDDDGLAESLLLSVYAMRKFGR